MGPTKTEAEVFLNSLPEEQREKLTIDNNGNIVSNNRAYRRKKPASDPKYTKATHSLKKERDKRREKKTRH